MGEGDESVAALKANGEGTKWGEGVNVEYEVYRVDSDGDGLSDKWETLNGRDPLVDRIQESESFASHNGSSRYCSRPIKAVGTRSNRYAGEAYYYGRILKISTTELCGAMMLYTVIHEMAHMAGNPSSFPNCFHHLCMRW